jgi:hypothetical protein
VNSSCQQLKAAAAGTRRDFGVKLLPVRTKPNAGQFRPVIGIVAAVLIIIIIGFWPMRYLAAPRWSVAVVRDDGQPLANTNVRLVCQNYSAEGRSHELTLITDENGRVLFPEQYERICVLQRLYYTVSSAEAGVHASFGRHAYVFAFGGGYEGNAAAGKYSTEWSGTPDSMESRIVVKKTNI